MDKIDPKEYQQRIDLLSEILTGIARHADTQSLSRCPYKNRFSQCTANFGCRNKRKAQQPDTLPNCVGDDKIDYRPAWETEK